MKQDGEGEARLAPDFDHTAAAQLVVLLEVVQGDSEQRDAFIDNPLDVADAHPDVDPRQVQDVLDVLASCTPEERAFLLDLNDRWPLRVEVGGKSCLVF
jgi:hypothetical protein